MTHLVFSSITFLTNCIASWSSLFRVKFDNLFTIVLTVIKGSHPENLSLTYDLYIDTTDGLQDPNSSNQNLTTNSKRVEVSSGNSYYWRVKSTDSNNNSSYSIIYSFRVD